MNAIEMIVHCGHHQSAPEAPFCRACGTATVLSQDTWMCPDCLTIVERRACPYCPAPLARRPSWSGPSNR